MISSPPPRQFLVLNALLLAALGFTAVSERAPQAQNAVRFAGLGLAEQLHEREWEATQSFDRGIHGGVQIVTPDPSDVVEQDAEGPIIVRKSSGHDYQFPRAKANPWRFLDLPTRSAIDATLKDQRFAKALHSIMIHSSQSATGNAALMEILHRHRGLKHSAYHFTIANGTDAAAGTIETGARWTLARAASATRLASQNESTIAICLIGNFNETPLQDTQLEALDELVRYLRARLGYLPVHFHRAVESTASSCPGRYLSDDLLEPLNRE